MMRLCYLEGVTMANRSTIEWTEATWNPVTGCTKISPGCAHCYAERFAERFRGVPGHPYEQGFDLKLWPERLDLLLKWKQPRIIFVNSMSDLFHEEVPDEYILRVFEAMARAKQHTFQVLTKRSGRMKDWTSNYYGLNERSRNEKRVWPSNVWLGVSAESQAYSFRISDLQVAPAHVRFLSIEPLLGPVFLSSKLLHGIRWVIVGGESGPQARMMDSEWVRDIQRQCIESNVPFFFKQWGTYNARGKRVGKKRSGRLLDGRTWDAMPIGA